MRKQNLSRDIQASQKDILEESILGSKGSWCKGSEAGLGLTCLNTDRLKLREQWGVGGLA